jgi:hypothetical protein
MAFERIRRYRTVARLLRLGTCGVMAIALWACGPVYIPVPPPSQISFTSALETDPSGSPVTVWTATGAPDGNAANAFFYLFDQEEDAGVIGAAHPDGSFQSPPMKGTEGDHITVYYQDTHGRDSAMACLLLSTALPFAAQCP